ncbi:uncharacterized protein BX663DRAFT_543341 [Cokeromyces recurvatus]|uniref:uncharacterized protein n=1 Tax=Cokeromyces recurvatus TaxID=90255 RepID=UPI00221FAC5C|nr:uncharacterized protein BX663DRAFT_543341 [Cokeromyces recurvatus]KAI7902318.1 hypothetical protein BX663DRAFT_543341 [Cokeromyces recurvatus]
MSAKINPTAAPYYTLLDPPLPPNPILSDVRINKKIDINHNENLSSLKSLVEQFKDRKSFWIDVAVLDRLHYKNMNQQRPFHRFKRSMELRRLLKRLKALQIDKELERIYLSFWNAKSLDKCTSKWNFIPSKESVQYTLHRLIGAALLLDKLRVTLVETYRANSTLLILEHFVSLALVYMGICSRLYKICHIWVNQIEECYHLLYTWSATFPSGLKQKEQARFVALNNLECDIDTLKNVRSKFAERTMQNKSCLQHKVHLETYIVNQGITDKVKEIQKQVGLDEYGGLGGDLELEDLGEVIER